MERARIDKNNTLVENREKLSYLKKENRIGKYERKSHSVCV